MGPFPLTRVVRSSRNFRSSTQPAPATNARGKQTPENMCHSKSNWPDLTFPAVLGKDFFPRHRFGFMLCYCVYTRRHRICLGEHQGASRPRPADRYLGSTNFEFILVTEMMDKANEVRVRNGRIEAEKPLILRPEHMQDFQFEGFGQQAEQFGDWLKRNSQNVAFLRYGFQFRRNDVREDIIHESIDEVASRLSDQARLSGNPLSAVIQGVDDTWEICLLKFTVEMIALSQGINLFDFRRKGLL
jgi:hypothetical protein